MKIKMVWRCRRQFMISLFYYAVLVISDDRGKIEVSIDYGKANANQHHYNLTAARAIIILGHVRRKFGI